MRLRNDNEKSRVTWRGLSAAATDSDNHTSYSAAEKWLPQMARIIRRAQRHAAALRLADAAERIARSLEARR